MPKDKISIGVSLTPIVESIKTAKVNEVIELILISGLTSEGIIWKSENTEVLTQSNNTVIFTEPGFYIPYVLGYKQNESYGILIN